MIKLMESQRLFKCLKYTSSDALSKADLTEDEIYLLTNQDGDSEDTKETRVLFTPFNLHLIDSARSDIRIYIRSFDPNNIYITSLNVCIQVIVHNTLCRLKNGEQRLLIMVSEILKLLNGEDVGFIGNLYVDKKINHYPFGFYFTGYEINLITRSI